MRKKGWGYLFVCILMAATFFAVMACPGMEGTAQAKKRHIVRIGWNESPPGGMNPFLVRNEGSYLFMTMIYEPLVVPYMDGSIHPWLAKKWEYKADEKTWYFYLDERAKWSDGKPVTADDVVFTFNTLFKYEFPMGSLVKSFVDSVKAADKHTVVFRMKKGFAAFLSTAGATLIMPKHLWEGVEKVDQYKNPKPVGSGPFLFKKYKPRAFMHVTRNPNYWRGPAHFDDLVIQVYTNQEAQVVALKKGELDILPDLSGSEALIPPLVADKNINVLIDRWPHILYIAPNYRIHPLELLDFRKAIDIAVDKKAIIETALGGYGELPLMGYVPPLVTKWANTKLTWRGLKMTEEERIKEANSILDNMGFKMGKNGVRVMEDGKPLKFTIRCYTNPSYIRACEIIKKNLEKIGIRLTVIVSDPETLYGGIIFSGKRPMDWQLLAHGSTMAPDPDHFAREYAPDPPNPWDNAPAFGWKDKELQDLLKRSRSEMDESKRKEMIMKAQELFAKKLVVITLGHRFHPAAYRTDKYKGWNPVKIRVGGMTNSLASTINLLSLVPK
ncbi:MAG: ABC transporter substrate-binding protein [Deltaproteobacteria bacterium]|nr:ABC transporter substrate-binding protein [Deltaproteobacteria bacterium]